MGGSVKEPEKTAEMLAMENLQRRRLNEEIAESERRLKATARGKLGKRSLLGQPVPPKMMGRKDMPTITGGYGITKKEGALRKKADKGVGGRGAAAAARSDASMFGTDQSRTSMSRKDPRRNK